MNQMKLNDKWHLKYHDGLSGFLNRKGGKREGKERKRFRISS